MVTLVFEGKHFVSTESLMKEMGVAYKTAVFYALRYPGVKWIEVGPTGRRRFFCVTQALIQMVLDYRAGRYRVNPEEDEDE